MNPFLNMTRKEQLPENGEAPSSVDTETWVVMKLLKHAGVLPPELDQLKELESLKVAFEKTRDPFEKAELLAEMSAKENAARSMLAEHHPRR